jgi:peptidoglycan/LPS O-acetylase OafA/YrhL
MAPRAASTVGARNRALDGLRGIAALAVVLFHFGAWFGRGGVLGVDVFFVLSGFLITNLLVRERAATGNIALRRFWARRAVRLWPPLALALVVAIPFASELSPDGTRPGYEHDAIAAATWSMDFVTSLDPARIHPIGHTWTLALEEQFYLVWPLILLACIAAGLAAREIARLAASLAVGSFVILVIGWQTTAFHPAVYSRPDARAYGVLLGCAVALAMSDRRWASSAMRRAVRHRATGLAALGAILAAIALPHAIDARVPERPTLLIGAPIITLAAAVLIAHVTERPQAMTGRALSWRPLVGLGAISYSLYLLHLPLVALVYRHWRSSLPQHGYPLLLTEIGIAIATATVWWAVVERPARLLARRIGAPRPVAAAGPLGRVADAAPPEHAAALARAP